MTIHFFKEIDHVKSKILALGAQVESRLQAAIAGLVEENAELLQKVIDTDVEIDELEVELEEECLKVLALHQPVAIDLRFVVAALKINSDLERIGDLAVNVAERSLYLVSRARADVSFDFPRMAGKVQRMLRCSIEALVNVDVKAASGVCAADDAVDAMNREMYALIKQAMAKDPDPDNINKLIHILGISRDLERIGDHATNIAEDIIYMVEGKIIRHHAEAYVSDHVAAEDADSA